MTAFLFAITLPTQAQEWSGNAALTSDYVWRGSSQTMENPALQGGVKVALSSGFYASAWGSNVKFAPELDANREFDLNVGWSGTLQEDWVVDVNLQRYVYPGTTVNLDWNELNASVTWKDRVWTGAGWSNNAMGTHARGTYLHAGARLRASNRVRFETGAGRYFLSSTPGHYHHAWVSGIAGLHGPFELRLTAHSTNAAAKLRFGETWAGTRFEAALQASF